MALTWSRWLDGWVGDNVLSLLFAQKIDMRVCMYVCDSEGVACMSNMKERYLEAKEEMSEP